MSGVVLRRSFWRSGNFYGCLILTVAAITLVTVNASRRWWWYPLALLLLAALWAACIRAVWSVSIRVSGDAVEVRDPTWGVQATPRRDVTSIEAHQDADELRGRFWYIHGGHGAALRLRTVWNREQLATLGRELGVPVCFGGCGKHDHGELSG